MLARQVMALFDGIQLQYLLAGGELDLVSPLRALLDSPAAAGPPGPRPGSRIALRAGWC